MGGDLGDLQRIGLKLFATDDTSLRPRQLVPIFHRWIQTQAIADQLLVDVADYAHVPDGPGVMLVAHEGNFSLDLGGGRMGLAYNRKTPVEGQLEDRLRLVLRTVLDACLQLEAEPALEGRLRFRGDELQLFANDRLRAPNEPQTLEVFQPALQALLQRLYGAACTITSDPDRRARFSVHVQAPVAVSPRELFERLRA
jgi:hypothetical protein